jgi:hypothetical protein
MDGGLLESLRYAGTGAVLGLAGGLTPGPLTTLGMGQTLQHGTREGVKVALVPALTDGPLVVASACLVVSLEGADTAHGFPVVPPGTRVPGGRQSEARRIGND